jgi:hypothetical protein
MLMPAWLRRILGRPAPGEVEGTLGSAMIMGVDYQRRGSNFDIDGKSYGIDRTEMTIDRVIIPYGRIRMLRINRSYIGGLLGRFSLPGAILVALGLMPAKRMQSVLRAEIVLEDGSMHAVSSMTARGFGKLPINQTDAFRWFAACLVGRLPPACTLRVGSVGSFVSGLLTILVAIPLGWFGVLLCLDDNWLGGIPMATTCPAFLYAGFLMLRDGVSRRVDAAGLLAYVGRE